jgi:hypothetical protein
MQSCNGLLPGVAPFGVRNSPDLVVAHLLRESSLVDLGAERGPATKNAGGVQVALIAGKSPGGHQPRAQGGYGRPGPDGKGDEWRSLRR